jgi:hypothetical protein
MEYRAPSLVVKDIDNQLRQLLRAIDTIKLARKFRNAIAILRQSLHDARIYAVDYELSETRPEQLQNAEQAKKYLDQASENILILSEENIFSAVDVALLDALIEQLKADLK